MVNLVRDFNWSGTGLGGLESWSPALRTATQMVLVSGFPQLLWWGPDYISIYNDAYRPILGRKHPWALGKPCRECWSEIWNVLKPLIDTPFHGGPATWMEEIELEIWRAGFPEETHFTVAYSPVPDETSPNGIGGVLATVHETTEKVVGERRITILRDLGVRSAEAKSVEEACMMATGTLARHPKDIPFALLYVIADDGKTVRLQASCGFPNDSATGPAVINLEHEEGLAAWALAVTRRTEQMQLVADVSSFLQRTPSGSWSDASRTVAVLPIRSHLAHHLSGFLVVGVSSRLRFDDGYRNFLELAATQIATAIANAQAYEQERRRAEALAEIDRAKTAFFSNVSHEFRTPLTLLLGPLEDVLNNQSLPDVERQRLDMVHRNSLRLLKLVNSLLDFSRIESGRAQASYQSIDLTALTADLASNFRSACEKAGLRLVVDCPPLPEGVYVDRDMWEKIVLNLLSNAFKFTFAGEIQVRLRAVEDAAELSVTDTGVGIPKDELPRLFERFHRIESQKSRSYEGSGIGLALVHELVRLHGGTIQVESEVNRGTNLTVRIPFGKAHLPKDRIDVPTNPVPTPVHPDAWIAEALRWLSDEPPSSEIDPSSADPAELPADARILLADDNADMRAYLSRLLGRRCEVRTVPDGQAALDAMGEQQPDLVIADVMMPRLDGFGLLSAIRSNPELRDIPVILLSARAGEESRVEGIEAGADDYLVKPFAARELIARIRSSLQLSRLRKRSSETIARSEERFRAFVTASSDVIYRMSPDWSEMLHLRGRDFIADTHDPSRSWLEMYIHPDDRPEVLAAIQEAIRTKTPFEKEHRVIRVDGSIGWTFSRAIPLLDAHEEIQEWFGTAHDVTQRKNAEAAFAHLTALSEQQRRLYQTVLSTTPDLNYVFDLNHRFIYANEALLRMWGRTAAEALGKNCLELGYEPWHAEMHDREIDLVIATKQPVRGEVPFTGTHGRRFYDYIFVPVIGASGEVEAIAGATRDITERKQSEERLRRANEDLEQFAYSASHDLQEPLRGVKIFSELLADRYATRLDEQGMEFLENVRAGATRMEMLVKDLLTYTQATQLDSTPEVTDAGEALENALANLAGVISETGATVKSGDLPSLPIHATHLQQLFQNIIGNAIKYRRPGVATLVIVKSERKDRQWLFSIADNGIGIEPEYRERIFGLFKRLHTADQYSGTGIGLAICQRIVGRYHGRIWVESEPGAGSVFRFTLPV
jgi:PAS domain S-box-containing protein